MMNSLDIFMQNQGYFASVYNIKALMGGIVLIAIVDIVLKGWALWRAARMEKKQWFIALLVINSAGILPAIFLFMTNEEYKKHPSKKPKTFSERMQAK